MEFTGDAATCALVGVSATLAFKWCKKWYQNKTRKEVIIDLADFEQTVYEQQVGMLDDELDTNDVPTRRRKGVYRTYLVKEGKAKFGTPKDTTANRMVVRKYLYDQCVKDGLLARHICDHLDIAVALVFVPSREEVIAAAITSTTTSKIRTVCKGLFSEESPDFA